MLQDCPASLDYALENLGGRVAGLNENNAKLSQPAGAGVEAWLSLAKMI